MNDPNVGAIFLPPFFVPFRIYIFCAWVLKVLFVVLLFALSINLCFQGLEGNGERPRGWRHRGGVAHAVPRGADHRGRQARQAHLLREGEARRYGQILSRHILNGSVEGLGLPSA